MNYELETKILLQSWQYQNLINASEESPIYSELCNYYYDSEFKLTSTGQMLRIRLTDESLLQVDLKDVATFEGDIRRCAEYSEILPLSFGQTDVVQVDLLPEQIKHILMDKNINRLDCLGFVCTERTLIEIDGIPIELDISYYPDDVVEDGFEVIEAEIESPNLVVHKKAVDIVK